MLLTLLFLASTIQFIAGSVEDNNHNLKDHPGWLYLPESKCGLKLEQKIFGGKEASIWSYPWLGQLLIYDPKERIERYACVVTLINNFFVLTAAHCVVGYEKNLKNVKFGDSYSTALKRTWPFYTTQIVRIESAIVHPEYDERTYDNDIALIHLEKAVKFRGNIMPICIPKGELLIKKFYAEKFQLAGWGMIDSSERPSSTLKATTLPYRDRCVCEAIYEKSLNDRHLCLGTESGEDTCSGDSGSPAIWKSEYPYAKYYIIGITSHGKEDCGEAPAIYTNLVYYIKWLLDSLHDANSKNDSHYTSTSEPYIDHTYGHWDNNEYDDNLLEIEIKI